MFLCGVVVLELCTVMLTKRFMLFMCVVGT